MHAAICIVLEFVALNGALEGHVSQGLFNLNLKITIASITIVIVIQSSIISHQFVVVFELNVFDSKMLIKYFSLQYLRKKGFFHL